MSNKPESELYGLLGLGLTAGLALFACRSPGLSQPSTVKSLRPATAHSIAATNARDIDASRAEATHGGTARDPQVAPHDLGAHARLANLLRPRLLPLLDAVEPAFIAFESADEIALAVDGLRLLVRSNGSFEVADGTLPVARQFEAMQLPARLGGGWLFVLASNENTWLMRADKFTGNLLPIGNVEVPTRAVTPGFEGIYVTLRQSGLVLSIDPKTGKAAESSVLPPAPEYGPIAIVDDELGAVVDPIRGMLVSYDAGQSFQPLDWKAVSDAAPPDAIPPSQASIRAIAADAGELRVEWRVEQSQQQFWLSRRGSVAFTPPTARVESQPAAAPFFGRIPATMDRSRSPDLDPRRSLRQWLGAWRSGPLGGWPIEVAVTRGAWFDRRTALVLAKGQLSSVRLRDGQVLANHPVAIPVDAQCEALTPTHGAYFRCERVHETSLYRLVDRSHVEPWANFDGVRDVIATTDHGIVLRGSCQGTESRVTADYCIVAGRERLLDLQLLHASGRERVLMTDVGELSVLAPPEPKRSGRVFRVSVPGSLQSALTLDLQQPTAPFSVDEITPAAALSERSTATLADAFWLQLPTQVPDATAMWLMHGDALQGARIDRAGKLALGKTISGATRAMLSGTHALVPDGSGFAFETADGGFSYQRPLLPVRLAEPDATIPHRTRTYGCGPVGCRVGDWLRVGWWASTAEPLPSPDPLEVIQAPDPIRLSRPKHGIPRLECEIDVKRSPSRAPPAAPQPQLRARVVSAGSAGKRAQRESDGASVRQTSVADPDGRGAFWAIEDASTRRYYLVEPAHPAVELADLDGREPRRITDAVRLVDGWYLLGTEPNPRLYVVADGRSRVVSEVDPRAQLGASRLRMLGTRSHTQLGYLALSARARSNDVEWLVYPVDLHTGNILAPVRVPVALRACAPDENGWVLEANLDLVADAMLPSTSHAVSARATGRFLLSESGLCIERMLLRGASNTPRRPISRGVHQLERERDVLGRFEDELGRDSDALCHIEFP
jgi:hypothetical protein